MVQIQTISMRYFKFLLISAIAVSSLSSCRKGPEDPLLSFTTRKNRISNTWQAYEYRINGLSVFEVNKSENFAVGDCGTQTLNTLVKRNVIMDFSKSGSYSDKYTTTTENKSTVSGSGAACDIYRFDKKESSEETNVGVWNFSGGVGNTSSREQVFIYQEETQSGYLWDIVRLANDELKLKRKYIKPGESTFTTEEIFFYPR